jgi:hypothetical protein
VPGSILDEAIKVPCLRAVAISFGRFQQLGDYSTTSHYDTLGNMTAITTYRRMGAKAGSSNHKIGASPHTSAFKQVFTRKKFGNDSLITIITFLKFKHRLDTAIIETKRYNSKGKLVEIQSLVTEGMHESLMMTQVHPHNISNTIMTTRED